MSNDLKFQVHTTGTNVGKYIKDYQDMITSLKIDKCKTPIIQLIHNPKNGHFLLNRTNGLKCRPPSYNRTISHTQQGRFNAWNNIGAWDMKKYDEYEIKAHSIIQLYKLLIKKVTDLKMERGDTGNQDLNSLVLSRLKYTNSKISKIIQNEFMPMKNNKTIKSKEDRWEGFYRNWEIWTDIEEKARKNSELQTLLREMDESIINNIGIDGYGKFFTDVVATMKKSTITFKETRNNSYNVPNSFYALLNELFRDNIDVPLYIPPFQREYAWSNQIIETFLEDIEELVVGEKEHLFLGAFVFGKTDISLQLLDGQQRVTTLLVVLSCLLLISKKRSIEVPIFVDELFRNLSDRIHGSEGFNEVIRLLSHKTNINLDHLSLHLLQSVGLIYKKFLSWSNNQIIKSWSVLFRNIKVIRYISQSGDNVSLFVRLNTTSQELSFLSLLKSFLMLKMDHQGNSKLDNYREVENELLNSDFWSYFRGENIKPKEIVEFVKGLSDFLNISIDKGEATSFTHSLEDGTQSMIFKHFQEKVWDNIVKYLGISSKSSFYQIDDIKKIIDFLSKYQYYFSLLRNVKTAPTVNKGDWESWINLMDYFILFRGAKNFHPLIIHYLDIDKGSKYTIPTNRNIKWLRKMFWHLEKIFIFTYRKGKSFSTLLSDIQTLLNKSTGSWDAEYSLKAVAKEIIEPYRSTFLMGEQMLSSSKEIRIHLLDRLELQRILFENGAKHMIHSIIPTEIKDINYFFQGYLTPGCYQLEHIIPQKKNDNIEEEVLRVYKDKKNTMGNHCMIPSKLNKQLGNKGYNEKKIIVSKNKTESWVKNSVYKIGKTIIAQKMEIRGAYEMNISVKEEIYPSLEEVEERTREITEALRKIIYK